MSRRTARRSYNVRTFETIVLPAMLDAVNRAEAEAGPDPEPPVRIHPENKGFALQTRTLTVRGGKHVWDWKRECWSSRREDMVEAARLRGWNV